jgi:hypothetical protein
VIYFSIEINIKGELNYMKKILIPILGAAALFSGIALSNGLIPVDGETYLIKSSINYEVTLDKNESGTYTAKPFYCSLRTAYPGAGGVEIHASPANFSGQYYSTMYMNNLSPVILNVSGTATTKPFDAPYFQVYSGGCSVYLDGDQCSKELNGRPDVFITCKFM